MKKILHEILKSFKLVITIIIIIIELKINLLKKKINISHQLIHQKDKFFQGKKNPLFHK